MEKILLLTDSASDLTPEDEARTGIRVLNLPVSVEGKGIHRPGGSHPG